MLINNSITKLYTAKTCLLRSKSRTKYILNVVAMLS